MKDQSVIKLVEKQGQFKGTPSCLCSKVGPHLFIFLVLLFLMLLLPAFGLLAGTQDLRGGEGPVEGGRGAESSQHLATRNAKQLNRSVRGSQ